MNVIPSHLRISPELVNLKQIDRLDRFSEPPREGILCDLIWADPMEEGDTPSKEYFIKNEVRGCSWFYTFEAATTFLHKNSLLSVIRAHEAQIEGYKMHKTNSANGFPTVTVCYFAHDNTHQRSKLSQISVSKFKNSL